VHTILTLALVFFAAALAVFSLFAANDLGCVLGFQVHFANGATSSFLISFPVLTIHRALIFSRRYLFGL
jgi:hypothetical protein